MVKFDDRDLKRLESDLKVLAKRAYPFATRHTVNASAFDARKTSQHIIGNKMVNRNKHAKQSVRVRQTKTLLVDEQEAAVGSIADYMEDQEFGAIKSKPTIATGYSAGQRGQRPRTRVPRRKNTMQHIRLRRRRKKGRSRAQRNLIAIRETAGTTNPFVYLKLQRSKGIFKVIGGKKRSKIRMVHDMTRSSVRIPANPWLRPAVLSTSKRIPTIYRKAMEFQAKRAGIFRG